MHVAQTLNHVLKHILTNASERIQVQDVVLAYAWTNAFFKDRMWNVSCQINYDSFMHPVLYKITSLSKLFLPLTCKGLQMKQNVLDRDENMKFTSYFSFVYS